MEKFAEKLNLGKRVLPPSNQRSLDKAPQRHHYFWQSDRGLQ